MARNAANMGKQDDDNDTDDIITLYLWQKTVDDNN